MGGGRRLRVGLGEGREGEKGQRAKVGESAEPTTREVWKGGKVGSANNG